MPKLVVFDTNILISVTIWRGPSYDCLQLAKQGMVQGITCKEIINEMVEILTAKFACTQTRVNTIVLELFKYLQVLAISNQLKCIPVDPDDDKIIECAVVGKADYIVSGDKKHILPIKSWEEI